MKTKSCSTCIYSIKDGSDYFCFYYKKYTWTKEGVPNWCSKYKEAKGENKNVRD